MKKTQTPPFALCLFTSSKGIFSIITLATLWLSLKPAKAISQTTVKTSYSEMTIPTYPWRGKDEINPPFRWTSFPTYSPFTTTYPYPTQDNLSLTKVEMNYKTMVLENEYLKVIVIPDLGGHVHSVIDKLTGKSIVYENKVLKPSLIGLRGAWTSGGIEFNTGPQGHTVTCLSPVEAKFIDFGDGSKGISIGNIEQVYHTQWVVTIRLLPGKDYLEEKIRIYNPTENKKIFYFWNCVAVENTDSSQLIYPMTLGQDHWGKTFYSWPVDKGKNLSWLKNYQLPTALFSYRCDQNFYGSYDHALDQGLLTYSNHYELEGKKSWTWGKGMWGARFQACLRDDSSTYNEIQTGPLPTQADYGTLHPRQTIEWQEWWYPVRGTKGVAYSNKDVTVNIFKDPQKQKLSIVSNGTGIYNASCRIEGIGEQSISISPDKASQAIFQVKNINDTFHIIIETENNKLADFYYPLPIPRREPPVNPRELPSDNTAAGCWLRGIQSYKEGGNHLAKEWFEKAIAKDESFTPAMTALAEQEVNAGRYEVAKKILEKCIKLNTDDGWAYYYLAQADLELGLADEALEMAYHAARCNESSSAAYSLAGTIYMRKGKFDLAIDPLQKSLNYNAEDLKSRNMLAYSFWKMGKKDIAENELKKVLELDPLDIVAGAILKKLGYVDNNFIERLSGHTEEILDLADFFINAGSKSDAAEAIREYYLNASIKESAPLIYYYYGILANDSKALIDAMKMNPDYVFPNTRYAEAILRDAVKLQPEDWKAHYYLGNFLFEHSLKEEAVSLWKKAIAIHNNYSPLHRNLGIVAWKADKKYWEAIPHYIRAIECNENDLSLYSDLASIYIYHTMQYDRAKDLLEKAINEKKAKRADLISLLGQAYNKMGMYDKAITLLAADSYTNWEGIGYLYSTYTNAHLGKGEILYGEGKYDQALKEFKASIEYPQTLGAGLTYDPENARSHYWIGLALEKLGKKEDAKKHWKIAADQSGTGTEENMSYAEEAKEKINK